MINDLVKKIRDEIFDSLPVDTTAVGLDDKVRHVVELFCLHDTTKVYALLIFGLGGVGKTTLAQAFYDRHRKDFEEASFVESCAEQRTSQIQDQLRKEVLRYDASDMRGDLA